MGSVSGALAGEAGSSMVVGGDFFWGDSTPAGEAENRGKIERESLPMFFRIFPFYELYQALTKLWTVGQIWLMTCFCIGL